MHCTPENLHQFRAELACFPALEAFVKDLHTQGLIPGLRAVSITRLTPAEVAALLPLHGGQAPTQPTPAASGQNGATAS